MNVIFTTQTVGLDVFYSLYNNLKFSLNIENVGFYLASSQYFADFSLKEPTFADQKFTLLKEWEIESKSEKGKYNKTNLKNFESKYGDPTIWEAILCDRRAYLGRNYAFKQDYKPNFSHDKICSILENTFLDCENMFDLVRPDIVLSLDPVTYGDYAIYLIAKAKKIPTLFLRLSKIKNYITFNDCVFGCSKNVEQAYLSYDIKTIDAGIRKEVEDYIQNSQKSFKVWYEGMVPTPSRKLLPKGYLRGWNLPYLLNSHIRYCLNYKNDSHVKSPLKSFYFNKLATPLRKLKSNLYLSSHYFNENQLQNTDYVFFPLHNEPEIATLIWGKHLMNQIETARCIASSIPPWMKLIVKDHPRSPGYRNIGYYKKLLNIPNLLLLDPAVEVKKVISNASLVITISSFVSFEAILCKIPTIALGGPRPFTILPDSMIQYVESMARLSEAVKQMLQSYSYDEESLKRFVYATICGSVGISYFGTILNKQNRLNDPNARSRSEELKLLSNYTEKRIKELIDPYK